MMKTSDKEKLQDWLQSELNKDKVELDRLKSDIIKQIKSSKKDNIFEKEEEKITVWQKFKKILMGI